MIFPIVIIAIVTGAYFISKGIDSPDQISKY
jgi:hypothetical protein